MIPAETGLTARCLDLESCPRRSDAVQSHPVGDELVLYDPVREAAISLNVSAATVWESCDGRATLGAIADSISELLGVDRDVIGPDVLRAARELIELEVLETEESGRTASVASEG